MNSDQNGTASVVDLSASNGSTSPASAANGHVTAPFTTPARNADGASFWQRPLDAAGLSETIWHPPLPAHATSQAAATDLLNEIADAHAASRWGGELQPYQGWYLRWFFETRAHAAQRELDDVVAQVNRTTRSYAALLRDESAISPASRQVADAVLHEAATPNGTGLNGTNSHFAPGATPDLTLEELLVRARHDFTGAAAQARLYVDTSPLQPEPEPTSVPLARKSTASQPAGHISPRRVEEALTQAAPNLPEIAGMHHLRYPHSEWSGEHGEGSGLQRFFAGLTSVVMAFAPLILGLMVALCLGSVSGLIDIEDLTRRPDIAKVFKAVLAVLLGGVVVSVLGKAIEATIRTLFDHLTVFKRPSPKFTESPAEDERNLQAFRSQTPPTPRHRKAIVLGLLCVLLVFAGAEVVAEGTGLKTLNDLRVANMSQLQQRQYSVNPIPQWVFYLVGVLFSGAYLYYKGADTWRRGELEAMRPWMERQRQEWLEKQRGEERVQALFRLAYLIEQMEVRREELRLRLDNARAAAVSEAELLHAMLEWIVNSREPMPMPTLHLVQGFLADNTGLVGSEINGFAENRNGVSQASEVRGRR